MSERIAGLHHVTSIAGAPRKNLAFYTDVLGLRMVKKTVNFDDPGTYHLYYGDEVGHPGTILTFFPFDHASKGRVGRGQTSATSFVVPPSSLDYWTERLDRHGVRFEAPARRFDEKFISFTDHEGQPLELVGASDGVEPWADGPVPEEHAIRGFFGVTLDSMNYEATAAVLRAMGYDEVASDGQRTRFRGAESFAGVVDVLDRPDAQRGVSGAGTVHHVAFRVDGDSAQAQWRERMIDAGMHVTEVKDRQYFRSIYFREPGGVLFEIATTDPGFTVDESNEKLGTDLKLPPWLESRREELEKRLTDLGDS